MINFNRSWFRTLQFWIALAITGLILAALIAAYFSALGVARDKQRVSDINAIQSVLQIYFKENNSYPTGSGVEMPDNLSNFLNRWPTPPKASGSCTTAQNHYLYSQDPGGMDYTLTFCLGDGIHEAKANGIF